MDFLGGRELIGDARTFRRWHHRSQGPSLYVRPDLRVAGVSSLAINLYANNLLNRQGLGRGLRRVPAVHLYTSAAHNRPFPFAKFEGQPVVQASISPGSCLSVVMGPGPAQPDLRQRATEGKLTIYRNSIVTTYANHSSYGRNNAANDFG